MSGRLLRILLAVAGPVFIGALAVGQAVNSAQIHGTVTDPTGAAVAGAEIKATQIATGLVRTTTSGAEGNYSFTRAQAMLTGVGFGVPLGLSHVLASLPEGPVRLWKGLAKVLKSGGLLFG